MQSIQGPIPFLLLGVLHCTPKPKRGFVAYLLGLIAMALSSFIGAITTDRFVFVRPDDCTELCVFRRLFDTETFFS